MFNKDKKRKAEIFKMAYTMTDKELVMLLKLYMGRKSFKSGARHCTEHHEHDDRCNLQRIKIDIEYERDL